MPAHRLRAVAALVAAFSLALLGLTAVDGPPAVAAGAFSAHGSAKQVYAVGLQGGATATLVDRHGDTVQRQKADSLGGVLFRDVKPGKGYRVRADGHTSAR